MTLLQRLTLCVAAPLNCRCLRRTRRNAAVLLLLLMLTSLFFVYPSSTVDPTAIRVQYSSEKQEQVADPYSGVEKGDVSWLKTPEDFFLRLENEKGQTHCKKMVRAGGTSCKGHDGGVKYICLDSDVTLDPRDCVAYSFGISDDFSFDDKAARFGCQVYMMDPTVLPFGKYDYLTGKQKFFSVGISNSDRMNPFSYADLETSEPRVSNITFLTYSSLHDVTGYKGPVHYIKMDVEGSEWSSLDYIMDNNLFVGTQQLMIEIHLFDFLRMSTNDAANDLQQKWLFLERLEEHGFLRVRYDVTPSDYRYTVPGTDRSVHFCGELFLIKRKRLN